MGLSLYVQEFKGRNIGLYQRIFFVFVFFFFLNVIINSVFTALRGMQTRSSDEKVVCPSFKNVNFDKKEERSVQVFIRKII